MDWKPRPRTRRRGGWRLTFAISLALCVLAVAWLASGAGAESGDLGSANNCEPEVSADLVAVACTLDTSEGVSSASLELLRQTAGASTSVPVWVQAWGGGGLKGDDRADAVGGKAGSGGKQGYAQVYFDSFRALTEAVGETLHYYVGQGGGVGDGGSGGASTIVSTKSLGQGVACIYAVRQNGLTSIADGSTCQKAGQSNIVLLAGGGGGGGGTEGVNDGGGGGGGGVAVSGSEPVFGQGADGQSHSGRRGLGGTKGQGGGTEGGNGPKDGGDLIGGAGGYPSAYTEAIQPGYVNAAPYGSTEFGYGGNGSVNTGKYSTIEFTGEGGSGGGGLGGGGSSGYGTSPYGPGGGGGGGGSFAMAGDEPPETGPTSSVGEKSDGKVRVTLGYSADCSTGSDSSSTGIRATCVLPADYSTVDVNFLANTLGAQASSDVWLQAWGGYGGHGAQLNYGPSSGGKGGYAQTQFDDVAAMKLRFGTAILHYYLGAGGSTAYGGEGKGGASTAVAREGLSEEDPPCVVAGETIVSDGGKCTEEADSNMILVAGGGGGGAGQPEGVLKSNGGAGGVAVAGEAAAFGGGSAAQTAGSAGNGPGQGAVAPATGGEGGQGSYRDGEDGASGIGGEGGAGGGHEGTGYQGQPLPLAGTYGYGGSTWAGGGGGMGGGGGGGGSKCGNRECEDVLGGAGGGGSFATAGEKIRDATAPSEKQPGEDGAFAVSFNGVTRTISAIGTPLRVAAASSQRFDRLSLRIRCPRLCVARTSGKVTGRRKHSGRHRFAIPLMRDATTVLSGRRGKVRLRLIWERKLRRLLREGALHPSARIRVRVYDRDGKKLGGRLVRIKRVRLHRAKHAHRRHQGKHGHRH